MASASQMSALLIVFFLLGSWSCAYGGVVKVCNGKLAYETCSNCCALEKGCMYLQLGTGYPTCIGGKTRACPRNCEGPTLKVCPSSENSSPLGRSDVQVVPIPTWPAELGCAYYDISSGKPIIKDNEALFGLEKKERCKVDSLVQVCNGEVSKENCGCCGAKEGCLFFPTGSADNTCLPRHIGHGICPRSCIPTVSVCSKSVNFKGTTLESCIDAMQSCENMKDRCSLYDRTTGEDKCLASIKMYGGA